MRNSPSLMRWVGFFEPDAAIPKTGEDGSSHTNPKRKRGRKLPPRSRFGLVSDSPVCGVAIRRYTLTGFPVAMLLASA